MFTGLVEDVGELVSSVSIGGDQRLCISASLFDGGLEQGESVAVNGVCLTVVDQRPPGERPHAIACFDVSLETLWLTTLGDLAPGAPINLERALQAGDRLGGHLVSGHVDGLGEVKEIESSARSTRLRIQPPVELMAYLARKGSVCLEGVSLTINSVERRLFDVNLVPHTLQVTTLQHLRVGSRVNLEVDMVARYLEQLVLHNSAVAARLHEGR